MNKMAEPVWDPAVHDRSWRAVWAYSRKRAARDGKTLTLQENRARPSSPARRPPAPRGSSPRSNGTQSLDEASLARARRLAGLKGYVTNIPAAVMPAGEVIASYHDLWHVEASFRMSKSDLRARPIFHHTRESIEAHLTIVFAALAVARYLQDATGMSIKKIVRDATAAATGQRPHRRPRPPRRRPPHPQPPRPSSTPSTSPLSDVPRWHESGYSALASYQRSRRLCGRIARLWCQAASARSRRVHCRSW